MSKESRRAARLARESRRAGGSGRPVGDDAGAGSTGAPRPPSASGTRRPAGTAGVRAGRRERVRSYRQPSFFERYRNAIVGVAAIAIAAIAVGWVFVGSTSAAYTCGNIFNPSPTPTVSPGSSTRLGFVEEEMGRSHAVTPPQKYLYCPPASGNHYNNPGVLGPIVPRVYKPDDKVGPPNWIHNLEHGAIVVLYRNDSPGATSAGQQAFATFAKNLPPSPICKVPAGQLSPVIARFDDMPHPYAALVWGRVLYFDTWDPDLVNRFYLEESERVDANGDLVAPPEQQCTPASASPGASAPAPSAGSAAPSTAPSAGSAAPSAATSAAPSASPAPSAAAS
ncbi:MAG TPA: DUF3105 domain-containing protein [Candidatus Limnocylindrales bacterium]|nr:DUF3105 domain-containing protein [Candidatus Limnocylindrales bacterium]